MSDDFPEIREVFDSIMKSDFVDESAASDAAERFRVAYLTLDNKENFITWLHDYLRAIERDDEYTPDKIGYFRAELDKFYDCVSTNFSVYHIVGLRDPRDRELSLEMSADINESFEVPGGKELVMGPSVPEKLRPTAARVIQKMALLREQRRAASIAWLGHWRLQRLAAEVEETHKRAKAAVVIHTRMQAIRGSGFYALLSRLGLRGQNAQNRNGVSGEALRGHVEVNGNGRQVSEEMKEMERKMEMEMKRRESEFERERENFRQKIASQAKDIEKLQRDLANPIDSSPQLNPLTSDRIKFLESELSQSEDRVRNYSLQLSSASSELSELRASLADLAAQNSANEELLRSQYKELADLRFRLSSANTPPPKAEDIPSPLIRARYFTKLIGKLTLRWKSAAFARLFSKSSRRVAATGEASDRLKAKMLMSLRESICGGDLRRSFLAWSVRAHPDFLRDVVTKIAVTGRINHHVAIWRMKRLISKPIHHKLSPAARALRRLQGFHLLDNKANAHRFAAISDVWRRLKGLRETSRAILARLLDATKTRRFAALSALRRHALRGRGGAQRLAAGLTEAAKARSLAALVKLRAFSASLRKEAEAKKRVEAKKASALGLAPTGRRTWTKLLAAVEESREGRALPSAFDAVEYMTLNNGGGRFDSLLEWIQGTPDWTVKQLIELSSRDDSMADLRIALEGKTDFDAVVRMMKRRNGDRRFSKALRLLRRLESPRLSTLLLYLKENNTAGQLEEVEAFIDEIEESEAKKLISSAAANSQSGQLDSFIREVSSDPRPSRIVEFLSRATPAQSDSIRQILDSRPRNFAKKIEAQTRIASLGASINGSLLVDAVAAASRLPSPANKELLDFIDDQRVPKRLESALKLLTLNASSPYTATGEATELLRLLSAVTGRRDPRSLRVLSMLGQSPKDWARLADPFAPPPSISETLQPLHSSILVSSTSRSEIVRGPRGSAETELSSSTLTKNILSPVKVSVAGALRRTEAVDSLDSPYSTIWKILQDPEDPISSILLSSAEFPTPAGLLQAIASSTSTAQPLNPTLTAAKSILCDYYRPSLTTGLIPRQNSKIAFVFHRLRQFSSSASSKKLNAARLILFKLGHASTLKTQRGLAALHDFSVQRTNDSLRSRTKDLLSNALLARTFTRLTAANAGDKRALAFRKLVDFSRENSLKNQKIAKIFKKLGLCSQQGKAAKALYSLIDLARQSKFIEREADFSREEIARKKREILYRTLKNLSEINGKDKKANVYHKLVNFSRDLAGVEREQLGMREREGLKKRALLTKMLRNLISSNARDKVSQSFYRLIGFGRDAAAREELQNKTRAVRAEKETEIISRSLRNLRGATGKDKQAQAFYRLINFNKDEANRMAEEERHRQRLAMNERSVLEKAQRKLADSNGNRKLTQAFYKLINFGREEKNRAADMEKEKEKEKMRERDVLIKNIRRVALANGRDKISQAFYRLINFGKDAAAKDADEERLKESKNLRETNLKDRTIRRLLDLNGRNKLSQAFHTLINFGREELSKEKEEERLRHLKALKEDDLKKKLLRRLINVSQNEKLAPIFYKLVNFGKEAANKAEEERREREKENSRLRESRLRALRKIKGSNEGDKLTLSFYKLLNFGKNAANRAELEQREKNRLASNERDFINRTLKKLKGANGNDKLSKAFFKLINFSRDEANREGEAQKEKAKQAIRERESISRAIRKIKSSNEGDKLTQAFYKLINFGKEAANRAGEDQREKEKLETKEREFISRALRKIKDANKNDKLSKAFYKLINFSRDEATKEGERLKEKEKAENRERESLIRAIRKLKNSNEGDKLTQAFYKLINFGKDAANKADEERREREKAELREREFINKALKKIKDASKNDKLSKAFFKLINFSRDEANREGEAQKEKAKQAIRERESISRAIRKIKSSNEGDKLTQAFYKLINFGKDAANRAGEDQREKEKTELREREFITRALRKIKDANKNDKLSKAFYKLINFSRDEASREGEAQRERQKAVNQERESIIRAIRKIKSSNEGDKLTQAFYKLINFGKDAANKAGEDQREKDKIKSKEREFISRALRKMKDANKNDKRSNAFYKLINFSRDEANREADKLREREKAANKERENMTRILRKIKDSNEGDKLIQAFYKLINFGKDASGRAENKQREKEKADLKNHEIINRSLRRIRTANANEKQTKAFYALINFGKEAANKAGEQKEKITRILRKIKGANQSDKLSKAFYKLINFSRDEATKEADKLREREKAINKERENMTRILRKIKDSNEGDKLIQAFYKLINFGKNQSKKASISSNKLRSLMLRLFGPTNRGKLGQAFERLISHSRQTGAKSSINNTINNHIHRNMVKFLQRGLGNAKILACLRKLRAFAKRIQQKEGEKSSKLRSVFDRISSASNGKLVRSARTLQASADHAGSVRRIREAKLAALLKRVGKTQQARALEILRKFTSKSKSDVEKAGRTLKRHLTNDMREFLHRLRRVPRVAARDKQQLLLFGMASALRKNHQMAKKEALARWACRDLKDKLHALSYKIEDLKNKRKAFAMETLKRVWLFAKYKRFSDGLQQFFNKISNMQNRRRNEAFSTISDEFLKNNPWFKRTINIWVLLSKSNAQTSFWRMRYAKNIKQNTISPETSLKFKKVIFIVQKEIQKNLNFGFWKLNSSLAFSQQSMHLSMIQQENPYLKKMSKET